jgi:hypothetical protein
VGRALRSVLEHPLAAAELSAGNHPGGPTEDGRHTTLASQLVVVNVETVRSIGYVELHHGAIYLQDSQLLTGFLAHARTIIVENLQTTACEESVSFITPVITSSSSETLRGRLRPFYQPLAHQ